MCFGFEHDDGWFGLVHDLSAKLEKINAGLEGETKIVASQVKEKYAGLRFYIGATPMSVADEVYDMIDEAEEASYKVCEACGQEGHVRERHGWLKTLCDECAEKQGYGEPKE
jgi:aminoglycoside phosphotransferase family enzyme